MTNRNGFNRAALWILGMIAVLAATPAAAGDGKIEINQARALVGGIIPTDSPGFPVSIGKGSYLLTSDLVVPDENTDGILVLDDDATIDLGGFAIRGPVTCFGSTGSVSCSPAGSGIGIRALKSLIGGVSADRTVVRNGSIVGMGADGLVLRQGALVDGVLVNQIAGTGVLVEADSLVTRSRILMTLGPGLFATRGISPSAPAMRAITWRRSGRSPIRVPSAMTRVEGFNFQILARGRPELRGGFALGEAPPLSYQDRPTAKCGQILPPATAPLFSFLTPGRRSAPPCKSPRGWHSRDFAAIQIGSGASRISEARVRAAREPFGSRSTGESRRRGEGGGGCLAGPPRCDRAADDRERRRRPGGRARPPLELAPAARE